MLVGPVHLCIDEERREGVRRGNGSVDSLLKELLDVFRVRGAGWARTPACLRGKKIKGHKRGQSTSSTFVLKRIARRVLEGHARHVLVGNMLDAFRMHSLEMH